MKKELKITSTFNQHQRSLCKHQHQYYLLQKGEKNPFQLLIQSEQSKLQTYQIRAFQLKVTNSTIQQQGFSISKYDFTNYF